MRVLEKRFFAVLAPEAAKAHRHGGPSPNSARSSTSARQASGVSAGGSIVGDGTIKSARSAQPGLGKDLDPDDCSAYDFLCTEKGFVAFQQWYQRALAQGPGSMSPAYPAAELGLFWPQVFCPPNGLHDHAFVELVRGFAECTDGEAFDFFDLLNHDFLGYLGHAQVHLAVEILAAMGSRQLTKFLYYKSNQLFKVLEKGSQFSAAPGCVSWPRLLMLLRLLGAPSHLISHVSTEYRVAPLAQLTYEDFSQIAYDVVVELDRGMEGGEIRVINENNPQLVNSVRSRTCAIL